MMALQVRRVFRVPQVLKDWRVLQVRQVFRVPLESKDS